MTIAERIKEYRKQHHYTQKELATLINVKPTTVSGWELGRNIPSIEMLQKLADIFHVPFDELAGVKDSNYHSSDTKENDLKTADKNVQLIAAHIDDGTTPEEMNDILTYIDFIKSKREKK